MDERPGSEPRASVLVLATTTWVLAASLVALVAAPERATALHLQSWSRATLIAGAAALALVAFAVVLRVVLRRSRAGGRHADGAPQVTEAHLVRPPLALDAFEQDWSDDVGAALARAASAVVPALADWCVIEVAAPIASDRHLVVRHGGEWASNSEAAGLIDRLDAAFPASRVLRARCRPTTAPPGCPTDPMTLRRAGSSSRSGRKLYGMITIANDPLRGGFDSQDLRALYELARRCRESLERVSLQQRARLAVRRSQRLASQLHQLIAASISIARIPTEAGVVEALATRARSVFDAETAVVTLHEGPGAPLVATATKGQETQLGDAIESTDAPQGAAASLAERVAIRTGDWIVVPILIERGTARGAVSVRRRDALGFSDDDVEIATLLAQMATSALSATEVKSLDLEQ